MGVIRGPISVRRYSVKGELPGDMRARFLKALRAHSFASIDPAGDEQESVGWVDTENSENADLRLPNIFFSDMLVVSMKIETLKPPPAEVKRQLAERARAHEAESGESYARRELRLLKATIERELRERIIPRIQVVDMAWDIANHDGESQLYFWATSKGANERFVGLFDKTFGKTFDLSLNEVGPGTLAHDFSEEPSGPTRELMFGFQGVRVLSAASEQPAEEGEEE